MLLPSCYHYGMDGGCRWLALLAFCLSLGTTTLGAQRLNAPEPPEPYLPPPAPGVQAPKPPAQPSTTSHLPANETILPHAITSKVVPPRPDPLIAAHDLNVGNFYMNRGDYIGALSRFEDAIYNDPHSPEPYCRAGDAEIKLKHLLPARVDWMHCGKAAENGGKWGKHARKALAKHPAAPGLHAPALP